MKKGYVGVKGDYELPLKGIKGDDWLLPARASINIFRLFVAKKKSDWNVCAQNLLTPSMLNISLKGPKIWF